MSLHDVSADKPAVWAVQTVEVVVVVDHILAERVRPVAIFHRVSAVNEVPLHHESSVSVQYWVAPFHLK